MDMRRPLVNSACKIKSFDSLQQVLKQPFIMALGKKYEMVLHCSLQFNYII